MAWGWGWMYSESKKIERKEISSVGLRVINQP